MESVRAENALDVWLMYAWAVGALLPTRCNGDMLHLKWNRSEILLMEERGMWFLSRIHSIAFPYALSSPTTLAGALHGLAQPPSSSGSTLAEPSPAAFPMSLPFLGFLQILSPGSPLLGAFLDHLPYIHSITLSNSSPHFLHPYFLITYFHITHHYHSFVHVQVHAACLPLGEVNIMEAETSSYWGIAFNT